jgi:hypothetical protein
MVGCGASTDQANLLSPNSMDHNQKPLLARHPHDHEALFVNGMIRIQYRNRKWVTEDRTRFRKSDSVLPPIR